MCLQVSVIHTHIPAITIEWIPFASCKESKMMYMVYLRVCDALEWILVEEYIGLGYNFIYFNILVLSHFELLLHTILYH